jgi:hypothetical protein
VSIPTCFLCGQSFTDVHDCETVPVPCPDGRADCAVPHVVYGSAVTAMAGKLPDQQDIERYCRELPKSILSRLPNNTARRRAEDLVDTVWRYAQESREKPADIRE